MVFYLEKKIQTGRQANNNQPPAFNLDLICIYANEDVQQFVSFCMGSELQRAATSACFLLLCLVKHMVDERGARSIGTGSVFHFTFSHRQSHDRWLSNCLLKQSNTATTTTIIIAIASHPINVAQNALNSSSKHKNAINSKPKHYNLSLQRV